MIFCCGTHSSAYSFVVQYLKDQYFKNFKILYITEEIIARKLARSLSQLSDKETDQEALKEMIERRVTIRKSLKRERSASPTKRQISSPGTRRQLSAGPERQLSQVINFSNICNIFVTLLRNKTLLPQCFLAIIGW